MFPKLHLALARFFTAPLFVSTNSGLVRMVSNSNCTTPKENMPTCFLRNLICCPSSFAFSACSFISFLSCLDAPQFNPPTIILSTFLKNATTNTKSSMTQRPTQRTPMLRTDILKLHRKPSSPTVITDPHINSPIKITQQITNHITNQITYQINIKSLMETLHENTVQKIAVENTKRIHPIRKQHTRKNKHIRKKHIRKKSGKQQNT